MSIGEGGEEETRPRKEGGGAHLSLAWAMEVLEKSDRKANW
jgi:hypothetical protein